MERRDTGLLIIISSPSGAGKSTLSKRLLANFNDIQFSVSATTRAPREGEVDGKDYYFYTKDEFQNAVKSGDMLEHAEVFGNYYGSPKAPVDEALRDGFDVIFDVDWQGGQQIRNSKLRDHVLSIFILPPSLSELETRLKNRGQDSDEVIENRMNQSRAEISHWAEYDYIIVNEDIDKSTEELFSIVRAERLKRTRWLDGVEFVDKLNREYDERRQK